MATQLPAGGVVTTWVSWPMLWPDCTASMVSQGSWPKKEDARAEGVPASQVTVLWYVRKAVGPWCVQIPFASVDHTAPVSVNATMEMSWFEGRFCVGGQRQPGAPETGLQCWDTRFGVVRVGLESWVYIYRFESPPKIFGSPA